MDKNKLLVILDNGHGNNTKGKRSPDSSFFEYQSNREIVKIITEMLEKEGIKYKVLVPEINDISLKERCTRVNELYRKQKANGETAVLISVHSNAAGNGGWYNARGVSVHIAGNASGKTKKMADLLFDSAKADGFKMRPYTAKQKYQVNNFYIIKNVNCPSVLTESLFYDNHEDCEILKTREGKEKIAKYHVEAIKKYIEQVY